ncbi:MAG: glycosyltransferase family 2 protein [Chloroflexota bacterium]
MAELCVCVPTARRPAMVARLLENLAAQTRLPDEILIVDASQDDETQAVVSDWQGRFPDTLRLVKSSLGLTLQRNVGIDHTQADFICMLDDDVLLEADCLEQLEAFLLSPDGEAYGAVSAYITNEYGRDFFKYQKLYRRLGIYDGELKPGRWLYCGDFLELSTLKPFDGIHRSEFIPAGAALFRRQTLMQVRPDSNFRFGGEDKHLTLRISQHYPIGVLGRARLRHDHVPGGVRRSPWLQGMFSMRNKAIILRECDPQPRWFRYIIHLIFQFIDLARAGAGNILTGRWKNLPWIFGSWAGWGWNLFVPPAVRSKRTLV